MSRQERERLLLALMGPRVGRAAQGCRAKRGLRRALFSQIVRTEGVVLPAEYLRRELHIEHGDPDIAMAQLILDGDQIAAVEQEIGGQAVAENMRMDALGRPGTPGYAPERAPQYAW